MEKMHALKYFLILMLFVMPKLPIANPSSLNKFSLQCLKSGKLAQGECVEVDRHLLCVQSFGLPEAPGVANVIFEPGAGDTLQTWKKVAPTIAKFSHVVIYDRTGFGLSQQYPQPKVLTAPLVVNNLITLLKIIHVSPSFILVGHSNGGLYMQYFALKHAEMIAGLILVDSSSVQLLQWPMFNPYFPKGVKKSDPFYYEGLGITKTMQDVKKALDDQSVPLKNTPLLVLTATHHNKLDFFTPKKEKDWQKFQKKLLKLSSNSYQIIADNSDHFIQLEQPQLVINAVYTIVDHIKK